MAKRRMVPIITCGGCGAEWPYLREVPPHRLLSRLVANEEECRRLTAEMEDAYFYDIASLEVIPPVGEKTGKASAKDGLNRTSDVSLSLFCRYAPRN